MKVVLDTNVLLAAFAARGLCETVFQTCLGKHQIVLCEHILKELGRNLGNKLRVSASHAEEIVTFIRENALIVKPAHVDARACRDANDLPVLGALTVAQADCLVTGDQDLLSLKVFHEIPILSPRAFHDWLR